MTRRPWGTKNPSAHKLQRCAHQFKTTLAPTSPSTQEVIMKMICKWHAQEGCGSDAKFRASVYKLPRPFQTKRTLNSWVGAPPKREVPFCTSVPARPRSSFGPAGLHRSPARPQAMTDELVHSKNMQILTCIHAGLNQTSMNWWFRFVLASRVFGSTLQMQLLSNAEALQLSSLPAKRRSLPRVAR